MKSSKFWKYLAGAPTGIALTTNMPHAESSGSAYLYPNGRIRAKVTQASVGKAASLQIYTPVAFRIVDAMVLVASVASGGLTLAVKNNASTLFSVTAGSDNYVKRPASIANEYSKFNVDDNDLYVIASCSSKGTVVVILETVFT